MAGEAIQFSGQESNTYVCRFDGPGRSFTIAFLIRPAAEVIGTGDYKVLMRVGIRRRWFWNPPGGFRIVFPGATMVGSSRTNCQPIRGPTLLLPSMGR
jgi:hypothetical protein